jgi:hypothetical protein
MNNQRRKNLSSIIANIIGIQSALGHIRDAEEESRDNIPENLQGSELYDKADSAARALDDACYALEEIIEYIGCAIE